MARTKDLTEGSPIKLILGFAIPMFLGYLFQQFYNLVDAVIVGRFLGVTALAGVGSTGSLNFMIIGFCLGVCSGFAIPVAQKFGAKDFKTMRRFVANSVWLGIGISVVMTLATTIFCKNILNLMKTPEDIYHDAYIYIFIIFCGIPSVVLYNMVSGLIRALGDSKTPLYFLIFSSFMNIGLDLFFILVMKLGVAGAALATVLSQTVSGILCLVYVILKVDMLHIKRDEWKADKDLMSTLCFMGVPMGLQYSVTAIGGVILQTAVNGLGSVYVASMTAGGKVSIFFSTPFDALGGTMATYGGQNVGAKKLDRLNQGLKDATLVGCAYSILAFIILYFFGGQLASLFVSGQETEVLMYSHRVLICNSAFYILLTLVNVVRFMIQGMGFGTLAIFAGICEMIARASAGAVLVPLMGFNGACLASPLAWLFADLFLVPAYFHCRKKLYRDYGMFTTDSR